MAHGLARSAHARFPRPTYLDAGLAADAAVWARESEPSRRKPCPVKNLLNPLVAHACVRGHLYCGHSGMVAPQALNLHPHPTSWHSHGWHVWLESHPSQVFLDRSPGHSDLLGDGLGEQALFPEPSLLG